ncbi:glycosyltransferase [Streptomyces cocklensis]|jgi:glycosyltransferase involved in cell wall biosynthesis|uniref:Glycosyltransferase involved in cell wall bisynthesis n=1 Tax=Actinacidiphila cocklensis TaxID=887465 RepID=A0A9W4DX47_9ACTN|nr:glycosyltransferase [Actinacidiphila cocklensis]MDD1057137.1 glycosyltransferase [Actinacidiphila cocklensis]WSX78299.1 glycosyltransferase [Streptomyces sp. NBC_00899]CAG6395128.1 Glycosyltransferase involved in cell wall bisynthesis [Actinacidiphila cocklensis]
MPQQQDGLAGLTVLHMAQPVEGGVARVVADLVRAQVRAGARVVVGCPEPGARGRSGARDPAVPAPDTLPAAAARAGAQVIRWPAGRAPGPALPREVAAAARMVRAVRPDLLHLHSAKAGLAARLAVRGRVPTVFQPHAWSFDAVGGATAAAARNWERYAARWADRVLCVSEAECRAGRQAGVRARWSVVRNGVDLARFTPAPDRDAVRVALPALSDAGPRTPLVVCVGRLCPQKGQDVLLRAWPAVSAALPQARLVLVGDGPDHRRLLLDAPPGVLLAGAARDTLPWYRAADVVVLPSRWEGMALAPLEAMACGRPVVTTDVSGAREALHPDDAAGCVVPVGDAAALSAALLRLLDDRPLRTAASLRALARARDRHDVARAAAETTAVYCDVLALPRSARARRLPR